MAIIIYSQAAYNNAFPQQYQKALPAPAAKPQHAPETLMGMQTGHDVNDSAVMYSDDAAQNEVASAPPPTTQPAAAPGPVLAPEPAAAQPTPPVMIPEPATVPPATPMAPPSAPAAAPMTPPPAQPQQLQIGDHLLKSGNPLDAMAYQFQQGFSDLRKDKRENITHKLPLNEGQHAIMMQALSQEMKNPDGSPMMYRAKTKSGKIVEKPMTLEKFVQSELRNAGIDPDEAFKYVSDSLRTTKKDFMSALKSKIFHAKKHGDDGGGWQNVRVKRSLNKFKDYFDPKSDKYVASGDPLDIAEAFERRAYGEPKDRKAKAEAWNAMYKKVSEMTGYSDKAFMSRYPKMPDANINVDERLPKDRVKGSGAKPFQNKQHALDSLVSARKLFTQFMAAHPEQAKKLGLEDFMTPGGKHYLSKAMVYPAEDNVLADIQTARVGLGMHGQRPSVKPNKVDSDDTDNQAFHDLDSGHSPDDDDDHLASTSKRTVVAAVGEAIYDTEDKETLLKVAMLLSSLRIPSSDAITASNLDTMVEWLDENRDLFVTDNAVSAEQKFAMAVKRVLNDCVEMLEGEEAFAAERNRLRVASFVLTSRIVKG